MWRVTSRSFVRVVRRTELWNGNRESLVNLLALHDPERSGSAGHGTAWRATGARTSRRWPAPRGRTCAGTGCARRAMAVARALKELLMRCRTRSDSDFGVMIIFAQVSASCARGRGLIAG